MEETAKKRCMPGRRATMREFFVGNIIALLQKPDLLSSGHVSTLNSAQHRTGLPRDTDIHKLQAPASGHRLHQVRAIFLGPSSLSALDQPISRSTLE